MAIFVYGKHIVLSLVQSNDAAFIYELRNGEKGRFLSQNKGGILAQESWIDAYKKREALRQEFYFMIKENNEAYGTVRIYDFRGESFCWGSWIIKDKAPLYVAIESALCLYEFGFSTLGFKKSHFDVRKNNLNVVRFHKRCGARIEREDDENYYFSFLKEDFLKMKKRYAKYENLRGGG